MNNILETFPSPVASYEDVVSNKDLFMSTLKQLHSELDTKFWIPNVRYKYLDLHKLFVEVTSRGGIEQTIREKRWREVADAFKFSISYQTPIMRNILRRYYYSLLHNYEIVYFFKPRNQFPPLIGKVYGKVERRYLVTFAMGSKKLEGVVYECTEKSVTQVLETQSYDIFRDTKIQWLKAKKQQKQEAIVDDVLPKQNTEAEADAPQDDETATPVKKRRIYVEVTGVLDRRFDEDYLVTVTMGSQKLRGFLYSSEDDEEVHEGKAPQKFRSLQAIIRRLSSPVSRTKTLSFKP